MTDQPVKMPEVVRYQMTGQNFDIARNAGTDHRQVTVTVVLASDYDASVAALEAENRRLREALEYYAVTPSSYGQVARAALGSKP